MKTHRLVLVPMLAVSLISLLVPASPLSAQEAARALSVDRVAADSLGPDDVDAFTIELPAGRFVYGEADQQSVDVIITVIGPDGEEVHHVDVTGRGREPFQFEAQAAGRYRFEVEPFERQAGRYTIALLRVEPIATRPADRVDQMMVAYSGADVPGGVIGVVRDGRLVFARAYGSANLTHEIPFTVETRTNIGSMSKQFTAFAILLLADRGKLSLDDDVRRHIPELPDLGATVTLRHLLTHTSGYREFLNTFALAGRRLGDHMDRGEIVSLIQRQPELQNEPGAEWNYNNSGYALLTLVVERAGGELFPDWMRHNVFAPLGMNSTVVQAEPSQIVRNSARGYRVGDDGAWHEPTDIAGSMGAGGIYTTVGDLARWIANFRTPRLGVTDAFRDMTTRYKLTDGDTTEYGLGLWVEEYRGLERVGHGGEDVAHRAMLHYFPEIDAGVLALSNNASFDAGVIADRVVDAFLGERLEPEVVAGPEDSAAMAATTIADTFDPADMSSAATIDSARFEGLAGSYSTDERPGFVLRFFRDDGVLFTQASGQERFEIVPTSDSTFTVTGVEAAVTFHRGTNGRADSLTLHQNGDHLAHRVEAETWQPTREEIAEYTGRYFSRELETFYEITLEEEGLVLRQRRFEEPVRLSAGREPGVFSATFPIGKIEFERDEDGSVVGMAVSNGRTRGVLFERVGG